METNNGLFGSLKQDALASLVVFLVAIPLCMGIAIASGVTPAQGLLTGIIGGLVVGWLAGCPLQVSGPAAGLTVIIFDLVYGRRQEFLAQYGDLESLDESARAAAESGALQYALICMGLAVFLAGLFQLTAALLRMGRWFRAVSPAVILGMLGGIGVLIVASQFHVMVDDRPSGEGLHNLLTIPQAIVKAFQPRVNDGLHQLAAATGVVTIFTILLWTSLAPRRLKVIPAPLLGIVVATIFAQSFRLGVYYVEVPNNLLMEMVLPSAHWTTLLTDSALWISAATIAAVASAETLLCATAVDQMNDGPRTRYDRELMAQGVGNTLCGLVGALPMTGVIVRSSANIHAGAKTRLSAILHGAWLLLFVMALPWVLNYIPRSALAAVLVYTGCKLVDWRNIRKLWVVGKSEVAIYIATITMIVVTDLLMGVLVGLGLAAAKLLYTFSHLEADLEAEPGKPVFHLRLRGACTFVRLPSLAEKLDEVPAGIELHVDLQHLDYIDHACLDLLMNWSKKHERTGGKLVIDWDSLHATFHQPMRREKVPMNNNLPAGRAKLKVV